MCFFLRTVLHTWFHICNDSHDMEREREREREKESIWRVLHCSGSRWFYMDSPPSRSPGRYEFSELGVARCWSLLSIPLLLHNDVGLGLLGGAPHNWLLLPDQVSGGGPLLFVGRIPQAVPPLAFACCWPPLLPWLNCCSIECTSPSAGDSAKIVVLPSTQLFNAPCA